MKEIKLAGLDQSLFYEKLENGLEVYLVPYPNKKNYSVHYGTHFGSLQTEFVPVGEDKMLRVPDGIAHFLEHKMFEQEDGVDPFSFYTANGCDCNASTTWKSTRYLFEGGDNLEENLDYLLSYVNRPYFTDENVEKEKGIIAEEIKMYDDDPDWQMERKMKEATFHKDSIRVDIAGTVESIYKITKEDLYHCYNTFYQPSNMFILATGNIDPEKMLETVKNNKYLMERESNLPYEVKKVKEDKTVNQKRLEVELNVKNQKVGLTFKIPWAKGMDQYLFDTYAGALLSILFGMSSIYTEEIREKNLATSFYFMREHTDDYLTFDFVAQTEKPDEFVNYVVTTLKNATVKEEDLNRIKKVWIASEVLMIDDYKTTLDNLYYDLTEFGHIVPLKVDLIKGLSFKKLKEVRKQLNFDNYSVVIVKPKESYNSQLNLEKR